MSYFALLDDAVSGRARLYRGYAESCFLTAAELDDLDACLQQGWQRHLHAVVFADYEFGLSLMNVPSEKSGMLAVHWFAECSEADALSWLEQYAQGEAAISTPVSDTDRDSYLAAIDKIHEAIRRGDTYQINYTTRLHLEARGNPVALYRQLRQPVPYAALTCLPDADGGEVWTLCFSPELFLNIHSDGIISTEPMKGTAPILNDGQDDQRALDLQNDPKNRAENIMIVDLLRNDLGKIAVTGGVSVPEPFKVSPFGSVWQMTSRINARICPGISPAEVFRAAFPCGSITGAPKRMSMQIIDALETSPRGLYTGSIGFLNPCAGGLGFEGVLNVVIRTLTLTPSKQASVYHGTYGVGSGIVIDSQGSGEYEECGWKARFLSRLRPNFGIFETLRVSNRQCALLDAHLARLQQSAHALNLDLPSDYAAQIHAYIAAMPSETCRLKISLHSDGINFAHSAIQDFQDKPRIIISPHILPRHDPFRRFKTDRRDILDAVWQQAGQSGAFDGLLFNSDGILLEGGRSNVFVKIDGQWHTPGLDLDILNGVMRQEVLNRPRQYLDTERVYESHITRAMLERAEKICLSNALRGVFEAEWV